MYIRDLRCISPQRTFDGEGLFAEGPIVHSGSQYWAEEPSYAGVIPNGLLRRMGKSVRLATGAAMPLLTEHAVDGIIIGSTDGGMEDCHRFLNQIIEYNEGTLTPTTFVQGSPSAVAGGLALMAKNPGYNNTHANKGISFENGLMDAWLLMREGAAKRMMVGCVEEISPAQFRIETLAGFIKKDEVRADGLYLSKTPGAVNGEGAAMFVVQDVPEDAVAEIVDFDVISFPTMGDLLAKATQLLKRNGLAYSDVDGVMMGLSGDAGSDPVYHSFADAVLPGAGRLSFKNIFGESPSASAFATWYVAQLLSGREPVPMTVLRQAVKPLRTILIHNHYQGKQHGFVLMRGMGN
ncbi:MAG: beta-ketoacyl synthase chain length factor [Flavobacteriales bacterium]|nr:beta-ketoacyl synthase chain length factor [Flavobacteriales bacterium]